MVRHMFGNPTNQDLASQNVPTSLLTQNNFRFARDTGGTRCASAGLAQDPIVRDGLADQGCRFVRRRRSLKRGSERRGSNMGFVLIYPTLTMEWSS
jgi:hypothetical protein